MTIEKATRIMRISMHNTQNIKSWCRKVLDLLDLTFADFVELHGTFPCFGHFYILFFPSNEGGNKWK